MDIMGQTQTTPLSVMIDHFKDVDRLGEKSLQDLLVIAEKVYNNWESPEDRQARAMAAASSKQTRDLARILLATTADSPEERECHLRRLADDSEDVDSPL